MLGVRFLDVDFMRIDLACGCRSLYTFLAQSNRDAERPTGSARATLPETCCGDDGRPSNDRQLHRPNAGFSTWSSSSSEGVWAGTMPSYLEEVSMSLRPVVARSPPGRGDFP